MFEPQVLRKWLQRKKREAAGQTLRQFLPGNRLVDGVYGKTRLLPQILPSLAPISKDSYTEAAMHWSKLTELMFKHEADARPNSKMVESSMAIVVLKALLGILITTLETCGSILSQKAGNIIFNTKLRVEKDCLQAWA